MYASSSFLSRPHHPSQRTPLPIFFFRRRIAGSMTRANPLQAMVQTHGRATRRLSIFQHRLFQQEDAKPASLSGYPIRILHGHLLALHPKFKNTVNLQRTRRALLPAHGFRHSVLSLDELRKAAIRRWPNGFLGGVRGEQDAFGHCALVFLFFCLGSHDEYLASCARLTAIQLRLNTFFWFLNGTLSNNHA